MERSTFLNRQLMTGAAMAAAISAMVSHAARATNIPAPNRAVLPRKYRAQPGDGACRLSMWSGVKKRMRAARRGKIG